MRFLGAIAWWGWDWLFLVPMALAGTAGIFIVTGSWKIWLAFLIAALLFEAALPMFNKDLD